MALLPKQEHLRLYAPLDGKFEDKLSETRRAWGYPASPADSSGNGINLSAFAGPASRKSPEAKFGWGYDLTAAQDLNELTNAALDIRDDLSMTLVGEFDAIPASREFFVIEGDATPSAASLSYSLSHQSDGRLTYEHYNGTTSETLTSTSTLSTGFHTITLRRNATTKTVIAMVDGVEFINAAYTTNPAPTGTPVFRIYGGGIDGALYEARIWDQLIDQAILDRIVDPDDSSYTGKPEGNELALWYMGTQPAAVTGSLVGANTLADKSGNGYTLTANGSPAFRSAEDPKWGGGYDLDDVNDYLESTNTAFNILGDLCITIAADFDDAATVETFCQWGDDNETDAGNLSYYLQKNADGSLTYIHEYAGAANENLSSGAGFLTAGSHTITLRRDTSAKTLVVRIDGVDAINSSYANNPTGGSVAEFRYGRGPGAATNYTDGGIYEVRIWDSLVEQSLLDDIANGDYMGRALGNELAYWDFATAPSTKPSPYVDHSGNGYTLTPNGSPSENRVSADPLFGRGIDLDNTDDYLYSDNTAFRITGDLSITMAFEIDALPASSSRSLISYAGDFGPSAEADNHLYRIFTDASANLNYFHESGAGVGHVGSALAVLTTGAHTVTLRRDATAKTVVVKLDGAEVLNLAYADGPTGGTANVDNLVLMSDDKSNAARRLDGGIYECRIWDTLVPQTVLDDVANGLYKDTAVGTELAYWNFENVAPAMKRIGNRVLPAPDAMHLRMDNYTLGPNLVANGGFETYATSPGFPGSWSAFGGTTAAEWTKETTLIYEGSNAAKFTDANTETNPGMTQTISGLATGKSYYVEAVARGSSGNAGGAPLIRVENKTDIASPVQLSFATTNETYTRYSGTLYVDNAADTYGMDILIQAAASGDILYVDHVSVREIIVDDSTANSNVGTLKTSVVNVEGPRIGVSDPFGGTSAMRFDGANDYVEVPDHATLDITGTVTVSCWAKAPTTGALSRFVHKGGVESYSILKGPTEVLAFSVRIGATNYTASSSTVADGTWVHLVGTYDGANVRIYVNGAEENATAATGSIDANNDPLIIGARYNGGPIIEHMVGDLADVRVYSRALSADEIRGMYENQTEATRISNGVVTRRGPARGMSFDGVLTQIDLGAPFFSTADFGSKRLTMAAWCKPTSIANSSVIGAGDASGPVTPYAVLQINSFGSLLGNFGSSTTATQPTAPRPIKVGEWQHLAATTDGTDAKIYVDGELQATAAFGGLDFSGLDTFHIGALERTSTTHHFPGEIAGVTVYDTALTAGEIKALMAATSQG